MISQPCWRITSFLTILKTLKTSIELSEFLGKGSSPPASKEYCCLSISKSVMLKCDSSSRAFRIYLLALFLIKSKGIKIKGAYKGRSEFSLSYHFNKPTAKYSAHTPFSSMLYLYFLYILVIAVLRRLSSKAERNFALDSSLLRSFE